MFEMIKVKIEELKAELQSAVNAEEIKADEAAIGLLQGWVDGLTAFKRVLEAKEAPPAEAPATVDPAPSEPAQEAKGDAAEPEPPATDPAVQ